MESKTLKPVAKVSEIPEGGSTIVEVDGRSIAIFRVEDNEFYAIDNTCPHQGGPLGEGFVEDYRVTCPWHAWEFDIRNGACETVPADRIKSYKTQVNGDDILLNVE